MGIFFRSSWPDDGQLLWDCVLGDNYIVPKMASIQMDCHTSRFTLCNSFYSFFCPVIVTLATPRDWTFQGWTADLAHHTDKTVYIQVPDLWSKHLATVNFIAPALLPCSQPCWLSQEVPSWCTKLALDRLQTIALSWGEQMRAYMVRKDAFISETMRNI